MGIQFSVRACYLRVPFCPQIAQLASLPPQGQESACMKLIAVSSGQLTLSTSSHNYSECSTAKKFVVQVNPLSSALKISNTLKTNVGLYGYLPSVKGTM